MGQGCLTPVNKFKNQHRNNIEGRKKEYFIQNYNYSEVLKQILKDISDKYLTVCIKEDLTSRTLPKRTISKNEVDEIPTKILRSQEIFFFDDKYSIEDLEEFLSNCTNLSPSSLNESNDSQCMSLYDRVLSESVDIEKLTQDDLEYLFRNEKIHLKLAEDESQIGILTKLFKRADEFHLVTDIIDIPNEEGNPAIFIAVLSKNSVAFFYLLQRMADIPLFISEKNQKIPFLIYLATHGKIRKSKQDNQIEYMLFKVLDHIIYSYKKKDFLEHLTIIDEKTRLSLPHLLLNLYNTSPDLQSSIIDCLKLCITNYPECSNIMCVNYYEPKYKFDVLANCISHPDLSVEVTCGIVKQLSPVLPETNKAILRHLVKVHQCQNKREQLVRCLDG